MVTTLSLRWYTNRQRRRLTKRLPGATASDLTRHARFFVVHNGPITLDLAITPTDPSRTVRDVSSRLTNSMGIENVIGTSGADTILGNARNNVLSGAKFLPGGTDRCNSRRPDEDTVGRCWISVARHPGEHVVFATADNSGREHRLEATYSGFDVRFVQSRRGPAD